MQSVDCREGVSRAIFLLTKAIQSTNLDAVELRRLDVSQVVKPLDLALSAVMSSIRHSVWTTAAARLSNDRLALLSPFKVLGHSG